MNDINSDDELYLRELQSQCRFSLRALTYVQMFFNAESDDYDIDEFWYHMQAFIVSCGNVALMMKQRSKKDHLMRYREHHRFMIEKYNLPRYYFDTERKIRNAFEHYDEQIIDWLKEPHNIRGLNNIGPINGIIQGATFSYLKHFDQTTNKLYFKDMSIDLHQTYNHLVTLDKRIEELINPDFVSYNF